MLIETLGHRARSRSSARDRRGARAPRSRRHGAPARPGRCAGARRPRAAPANTRATWRGWSRRCRCGGRSRNSGRPSSSSASPGRPRRPVRPRLDRRVRQAAQPRAAVPLDDAAAAAARRPGRRARGRVRALRCRAAGGGLDRAGAPRRAAGRHRSGRQGAAARHRRHHRGRPAPARPPGRASPSREWPALQALPPAPAGARSSRARCAASSTSPPNAGIAERIARQPRGAARGGDPARALGVHQRARQRAGLHRRHPRRRPGRASTATGSTASCSPAAARARC